MNETSMVCWFCSLYGGFCLVGLVWGEEFNTKFVNEQFKDRLDLISVSVFILAAIICFNILSVALLIVILALYISLFPRIVCHCVLD